MFGLIWLYLPCLHELLSIGHWFAYLYVVSQFFLVLPVFTDNSQYFATLDPVFYPRVVQPDNENSENTPNWRVEDSLMGLYGTI